MEERITLMKRLISVIGSVIGTQPINQDVW